MGNKKGGRAPLFSESTRYTIWALCIVICIGCTLLAFLLAALQ